MAERIQYGCYLAKGWEDLLTRTQNVQGIGRRKWQISFSIKWGNKSVSRCCDEVTLIKTGYAKGATRFGDGHEPTVGSRNSDTSYTLLYM